MYSSFQHVIWQILNQDSLLSIEWISLGKSLWIPTLFCYNSIAQLLKLKSNLPPVCSHSIPVLSFWGMIYIYVHIYVCMYLPQMIHLTSQTKHFEDKFYFKKFTYYQVTLDIYPSFIKWPYQWKKCLLLAYDIFSLYLKNSPTTPIIDLDSEEYFRLKQFKFKHSNIFCKRKLWNFEKVISH